MSKANILIVGEFFNQGMVVCGKECSTSDVCRKLLDNCTGYRRAIIGSSTATCKSEPNRLFNFEAVIT
ncbi:hypothetical protein DPMN_073258 [Dreissena polymorpha]|uniref:Uncharacterized protein n=1 Tax=Dreissena polymorpha TaxID=45954 RepID=A0A9D4BYP9_DREPO|nr:hypothetical protein DPMN_073258 [Dreissena polymorpha]